MAAEGSDLRIVLIGAGSVSFGLSTLGDLMTVGFEALRGSTIVLHDLVEKYLHLTSGVLKLAMDQAAEEGEEPPFKVESTTDPREALQGANYVVMSIEHGNRMETWTQDYYVPRKYGSKQIYGENGGPGGAFHTWRQVPPMLDICHLMEDVCPDAWMLNYSNPVPRVTWAMSKATKIKTVGLCHGITAGLTSINSILGVPNQEFDWLSAGLNHFYWFIKANAKHDLKLRAMGPHPEKEIAAGDDVLPDIRERGITWAEMEERPLIAELLRTYGYLTYPEQSHPGEYIPWADAYCPSVKYDFKGFAHGGDEKKANLDKTLAGKMDNYWWVHFSNERAIPIIDEITHNTGAREIAVNIPNHGAISNLPDECVVEVPAIVDAQGIHGESIGAMPRGIAQLLQHEVAVQALVVEAALTGDYDTGVQAIMQDDTVPSVAMARAIMDEMLRLQGDLLPQFMQKQ
ncbi:MAG TPA: hypothetical protein VKK79_21305 [Candidatus Lokiarchaeia archaeon]|nr:hypothetical protein [Candidatus Lokiarchaeia archaeon]